MKNLKTSIVSPNKKKYRPATALKLEKSNPQVSDSEIGQLERKTLGGDLQTLNYQYNIRGWLTQTNDPSNLGKDLFAFTLGYNTSKYETKALYNGNIAFSEWRSVHNTQTNWYAYQYDALNRLKIAAHSGGKYSMAAQYDKNGNIENLNRKGYLGGSFGNMDALVYSYAGNQLKAVQDTAEKSFGFKDGVNQTIEYTYDVNGNMLSDANKRITNITYNHLNLPTQVNLAQGNIDYLYDASGAKIKKTVQGNTTEYFGNTVYQNGELEFIHTPEGYIEPTDAGYEYIYRITDHLGNTRVSFKKNVLTDGIDVLATNDYYPFGLEHNKAGTTVESSNLGQRYKFAGKELEEDLDLNTVAYEWRAYDPAKARFNNVDRFAEEYKNVSPYQFALNSPIRYSEIKGDSINLRPIQKYDEENGTNFTETIVSNLSEVTGLELSVNNETGMLGYATDDDGNAIVTQVAYEDENGVITNETVDGGSKTARNDLISAIKDNRTAWGRISNRSSAPRGGLLINMSPNQINKFINGANNVNNNTLGYGMTFLHEMHHSGLGLGVGDDKSSFGATGGVVNRMNVIRRELSDQSFTQSYGQRTSYIGRSFNGGSSYLPMDQGSYLRLNANRRPTTASQKFIKF